MKRTSSLILPILLITLLMACNPESTLIETDSRHTEEASPGATEQASSPPPTSTHTPERTTTLFPSEELTLTATAELEAIIMDEEHCIDLAKKTLVEKLNLNLDLIEVISIQELEWPDTSLGCPEKGVFYISVLVPGFKVVLEANGQEYDVHIGDGRAVICVDSQPLD
jgi:hypothetical protein